MKPAVYRLVGAARLDRAVYAGLRGDTSAPSHALWLVALLGAAHGIGGAVRGLAFDWSPAEGALFGLVGELLFFFVATLTIYVLGRFAMRGTGSYLQVVRLFAYASVPGFLILVAAALSVVSPSAGVAVFPAIIAWRLAASYIAVREVFELNMVKSLIVVVIGVVSGIVAVGMGSGALVLLLKSISGAS